MSQVLLLHVAYITLDNNQTILKSSKTTVDNVCDLSLNVARAAFTALSTSSFMSDGTDANVMLAGGVSAVRYKHTDIQTDGQIDRRTSRQTDWKIFKQTDIHTEIQTDMHKGRLAVR